MQRSKNDELGFLVQSFNYMTLQLEQARDNASRSQQLVERQRAWLEAVLGKISSGVVTLDESWQLRTCNAAAIEILGPELLELEGQSFRHSALDNSIIAQFSDQIHEHLQAPEPALAQANGRARSRYLTSRAGASCFVEEPSCRHQPVCLRGMSLSLMI